MPVPWIKMAGLWPLDSGGRQRTFQIVSALARAHDIRVLTTHDPARGRAREPTAPETGRPARPAQDK
jgi:hypothetical protein